MMKKKTKEFLTIREYSRLVGISEKGLYRMAKEGRLRGAVQIGSRWRINLQEAMGRGEDGK